MFWTEKEGRFALDGPLPLKVYFIYFYLVIVISILNFSFLSFFFLLDSSFLSSPLLFDLDKDGKEEIVVTTKEAEIIFLTTEFVF